MTENPTDARPLTGVCRVPIFCSLVAQPGLPLFTYPLEPSTRAWVRLATQGNRKRDLDAQVGQVGVQAASSAAVAVARLVLPGVCGLAASRGRWPPAGAGVEG